MVTIRTSNDDLLKDVCALSQLLEKQCIDRTETIGLYTPEHTQCHTDGLDEYRSHRDMFVEALSHAFFNELSRKNIIGKLQG